MSNTPVTSTGNQRKRVGYYADVEDEERIRAAFIAARNAGRGYRSLSEFQLAGVLALTAQMEQELNGGVPFDGAPAHSLSPGRPLD